MKTFYKGTSAVLLTYDISDKKSFSDLEFWFKQISNLLFNLE
jgi:GTPase SAR1 family protein